MTATTSFTVPGLGQADTAEVLDLVHPRLHALIDLSLTLKHIHWNVVGPTFIAVHQMLDPQYAAVSAMVDELAERIATLGGSPNGLPGNLVKERAWDDYALAGRATVETHLEALDRVYDGVVGSHRSAIEGVGEHDPVTEDLLIGQVSQLEQFQWFVRAHLENSQGALPDRA